MSAKTLTVRKLVRTPTVRSDDTLVFENGVNVIVGEKDAGKTRWLQILDYLMGEPGAPEDSFGDLVDKYDSAYAEVKIAGEALKIERKWKVEGAKGKVFVNDTVMPAGAFSQFLLEKLGIPVLHFPKDNPYAERAWPELSWRMLLRHIYRQERFWGDFADKQPDAEQHACLAQFLGAAEALFPPGFGELVAKERQLERLEMQRDSYLLMLSEVTREILAQSEISVTVTPESVGSTLDRLNGDVDRIRGQRSQILASIREQQTILKDVRVETMRSELTQAYDRRVSLIEQGRKAGKRRVELGAYATSVKAELERLSRAQTASMVLADLKITHCPACDQPVSSRSNDPAHCYLCHQSVGSDDSRDAGLKRIDFEHERLKEEASELEDLIGRVDNEIPSMQEQIRHCDETIARIEADLQPVRELTLSFVPPELAMLDREAGRLEEQIAQLPRVEKAFERKRQLADEIEAIREEEARLRTELEKLDRTIDYPGLSNLLADRMNSYLNELNAGGIMRWTASALMVHFKERNFDVTIDENKWSTQIGVTSQALVLFAYHYALLSLVADAKFNYPGIVIIDLPIQLLDGTSIADKENYLLEPFVKLCARKEMAGTQVIAAGHSFANLNGAHRLQLARSP